MAFNRFRNFLLAVVVACGAATPGVAQSLKSSRAQAEEERALATEAGYTSDVCGVEISTQIDWSSADDWPEGVSLAEACGGALSAIEASCRAGAATPVRTFVCAGDGGGASLSGDTLRFGASPNGDAYGETAGVL